MGLGSPTRKTFSDSDGDGQTAGGRGSSAAGKGGGSCSSKRVVFEDDEDDEDTEEWNPSEPDGSYVETRATVAAAVAAVAAATQDTQGTQNTRTRARTSPKKGANKGASKTASKGTSQTAGKTAGKTASTPDAQPVYTDVIEGLEDRRLEDKQIQYLARVMSTTTTASASASASRTEWFTCSQLKRQKAAGTESIEKMMRVLDDQLWCSSSGGGISMAASAVASIGSANKTVRVKVEPVSQRFATAGPLARPICTASANKPARAVKVEPHHRVARRSIRAQQLMIGTRVMAFPACSPNTAKRYPGRIAAYCGNNCYNVDYDDGDQDTEVPRVNINVCDP